MSDKKLLLNFNTITGYMIFLLVIGMAFKLFIIVAISKLFFFHAFLTMKLYANSTAYIHAITYVKASQNYHTFVNDKFFRL